MIFVNKSWHYLNINPLKQTEINANFKKLKSKNDRLRLDLSALI